MHANLYLLTISIAKSRTRTKSLHFTVRLCTHTGFHFFNSRKFMFAKRLIYTAIAFFAVGIALGMYMGITHDFSLVHVHVHINLLGWVALGLIGLLYAAYPSLQQGWLPQLHYWLHTLGLLLFMGGFAWRKLSGELAFVPVAVGSSMVATAVLLLAVHVFSRLPRSSSALSEAAL
jgi:cbb3-type cytochrome oxidase subunit 1